MARIWTIVVAAGSGSRFGQPKQYASLAGRRVLDHSIAAARSTSDGIVLVVPLDRIGDTEPTVDAVVAGGDTRSESVRNGLQAVPDDADIIAVHDAARPLADDDLFRVMVDAVRAGADAAVPAVPVVDTIRHVDGGIVDRSDLVAVQTPQTFGARALRSAHRAGGHATDDASLVEADGGKVVLVPGTAANLKITQPHDLVVAEALLAAR